jgi:hypothetical protein
VPSKATFQAKTFGSSTFACATFRSGKAASRVPLFGLFLPKKARRPLGLPDKRLLKRKREVELAAALMLEDD